MGVRRVPTANKISFLVWLGNSDLPEFTLTEVSPTPILSPLVRYILAQSRELTMAGLKPSTWVWVALHLVFPLSPFLVEGLIRLAVNDGLLSFDTFRAPTLAMSIGLISVFINQSLRSYLPQLADETEIESIAGASALFLIMAIVFFVLFGILVLLNALVNDRGMKALITLFRVFQSATFIGWVVLVVTGIVAQRSFKLRAAVR